MAGSSEKRMLTAANSKLSKADLEQVLGKDGAWESLSLETRQHLYSLLPAPLEGQPPHDPNVNPLRSAMGKNVGDGLRRWQDDLKDGRESRKWREEAIQAGRDRASGKFDVLLNEGREEDATEDYKGRLRGRSDGNGQ